MAGIDTPRPSTALSERLGDWIDWRHAVALAATLDARPGGAAPVAAGHDDGAFERARAILDEAIANDRAFRADAEGQGAAFFRQRGLALQQKMEAEVGHLRGRLRARLQRAGGAAARLAAIDAVMERALGPRERALLAPVPELIERRCMQALQAANAADAPLLAFQHDMRELLLAELDLRLQPARALYAALCTHDANPDAV